MKKNYKDEILSLFEQGLSQRKIAEIVRCSRTLVRYYTIESYRLEDLKRKGKRRKNNPLKQKIKTFSCCHYSNFLVSGNRNNNIREILDRKRYNFSMVKKNITCLRFH